jgi:hypothetical protein
MCTTFLTERGTKSLAPTEDGYHKVVDLGWMPSRTNGGGADADGGSGPLIGSLG